MVQDSGPLVGQNFTDEIWRTIFGGEPGIVSDTSGMAYQCTLPTGSDDVAIGAASEDSRSVVAGFAHRIPAGDAEELTIPSSATSTGRTDLIVVRYDPTWTTAPGPCRLHRIAGTDGSATVPAHDDGPPGVEDMPLWAITRRSGQALSQASVVDMRRWQGPTLYSATALGSQVPLGSTFVRGSVRSTRVLSSNGSPAWQESDARGSIGERPSILTRRSEALGLNIPDPWIPSFNTIVDRQAATVGMSRVGNSYANPARIRFDQAGLYAIGFSAEVLVTGGAIHFGLGVMAGAVEPASYLGSQTARSSTSPQRVSVGDTRWLRAGTEIGVSVQHTSFEMSVDLLGANFWATWLGN